MTCQGTAVGQSSTSALSSGVTTLVPGSVTPGGAFAMKLTADPVVVPTTGGGYAISYLKSLTVKFAIPAGATFVSASQSGGSNLGSGAVTVSASGSIVTLSVPGNLAGGTTAILPEVTINLQATGASGTALNAQLYGSSYSSFSIGFTARVTGVPLFGSVDAVTKCYAPVNPILGTTVIS